MHSIGYRRDTCEFITLVKTSVTFIIILYIHSNKERYLYIFVLYVHVGQNIGKGGRVRVYTMAYVGKKLERGWRNHLFTEIKSTRDGNYICILSIQNNQRLNRLIFQRLNNLIEQNLKNIPKNTSLFYFCNPDNTKTLTIRQHVIKQKTREIYIYKLLSNNLRKKCYEYK